jgi:hypothetical protein
MTPSLEVDVELEVSANEFGKMRYLLNSIQCMDGMYQDFKRWRKDVAFGSGVTVDAKVEWRSVVMHCAPQVLVVLVHDKSGSEFEDFPLYAVLPESHQFIRLDGPIALSIKERDDAKAEVDVQGALKSLQSYVETVDGGKKENALRQLQILKRILR